VGIQHVRISEKEDFTACQQSLSLLFFQIFLIAFEIWAKLLFNFVISKIWQFFHTQKRKEKKN
jgi:hypothetical protein